MSSAETPPGSDEPETTAEEDWEAVKGFLFWIGWGSAVALIVIGYGQAVGRIQFF